MSSRLDLIVFALSVLAASPASAADGTRSATVAAEQGAVAATEPSTLGLLGAGLHLSGWMQIQYENSALSQDERLQGGALLNRDRFVLRRGRLRLDGRWSHLESTLELDATTSRGASLGIRRAYVAVKLPGAVEDAPLVRVTAGLTEVPFGHEVRGSQREQRFMERSAGSLAFFPGPVDLGLRVDGALGAIRYDLAVTNGAPLDERGGAALQDPTSAPDLVGRVGVDARASEALGLAFGASFLWGTGFHAGTDATKNRLEWKDLNENGTLDLGETIAIPGQAATPSATFRRWAVGVDARAALDTSLGRTELFGEVVLASNLDRGLFVADPVTTGADVREVAAYVALLQDLGALPFAGVRYDFYDPNSDLLDQRRGVTVPADASLHTISPLVGVRLPASLVPGVEARLIAQYDVVFDALGRDAQGVPADLKNDQLTIRIQGELP